MARRAVDDVVPVLKGLGVLVEEAGLVNGAAAAGVGDLYPSVSWPAARWLRPVIVLLVIFDDKFVLEQG